MNNNKIKVSLFDSFNHYIGAFIPSNFHKSANILIEQVRIYEREEERLEFAKKIIVAATHNILSNLRYYNKKRKNVNFKEYIDSIETSILNMKKCSSNKELLLEEARMREQYYSSFNIIINNQDFSFSKRTKRPPKDELNAMISFGNTLVYQIIALEIYKTQLDIRISYLHSSKRRYENLNLDVAELFKPFIVDKVIFLLTNKIMIDKEMHFEKRENGVYLNMEGKRLFINQFNKKLFSKITINQKEMTYYSIIRLEVLKILRYFKNQEEYKPFKYRM